MSAPSLNVARAYSHPLRVLILDTMRENVPPTMSPVELAGVLDEPLGTISYHVKKLLEFDMVELTGTRPRRGAVEHFYTLTREAKAVGA